jgi:hypothetical protein
MRERSLVAVQFETGRPSTFFHYLFDSLVAPRIISTFLIWTQSIFKSSTGEYLAVWLIY